MTEIGRKKAQEGGKKKLFFNGIRHIKKRGKVFFCDFNFGREVMTLTVRAKVNAVLFAMFFGHAISVFGIVSSQLDFKATGTVLVGDDFAIQDHWD